MTLYHSTPQIKKKTVRIIKPFIGIVNVKNIDQQTDSIKNFQQFGGFHVYIFIFQGFFTITFAIGSEADIQKNKLMNLISQIHRFNKFCENIVSQIANY